METIFGWTILTADDSLKRKRKQQKENRNKNQMFRDDSTESVLMYHIY